MAEAEVMEAVVADGGGPIVNTADGPVRGVRQRTG